MKDMMWWYFRVETDKGRFYSSVEADSKEEAEEATQAFYDMTVGFDVKDIVNLARQSFNGDHGITVLRASQPLVGKAIWETLGWGEAYRRAMREFAKTLRK